MYSKAVYAIQKNIGINPMKEVLYLLGNIIHHAQKERGCVSMYLYSNKSLFWEEINKQFNISDREIQHFNDKLDQWVQDKTFEAVYLTKFKKLLQRYKTLPEVRDNLINNKVSASQKIDYYSNNIIGVTLHIMVEVALYNKTHDPNLVSAYNAFLQWKERIGLERALGTQGFLKRNIHKDDLLERILLLLSEQKNYRNTYMLLASPEQKQLVEEMLAKETSIKLRDLHDTLKHKPESAKVYDITPKSWFTLITAKIDELHIIEHKLINTLDKKTKARNLDQSSKRPTTNLGHYRNFISALQIFSGIVDKDLQNFLCSSSIRELNKGKLLFLENEQINRFYIILKGWVKIFKGNEEGEETILQMLSAGDLIMESAFFINSTFPANAQIVEKATLLSIPAPVMRDQVKVNNTLALNLLTSMSHRSQLMMNQIKDTRLKSVDERVGWFLLKLLLEQGCNAKYLTLPYDKVLIASYLNMSRETFSRSLHRLKERGFKVENDLIFFPGLSSLCVYCDENTMGECPNLHTSYCLKSSNYLQHHGDSQPLTFKIK